MYINIIQQGKKVDELYVHNVSRYELGNLIEETLNKNGKDCSVLVTMKRDNDDDNDTE